MIRIAITGAAGRMGRTVAEAVRDADDLTLGAALEHPDSSAIGDVIDGVRIARELVAEEFDVLVDFSTPVATLGVLEACVRHKKGMVIGTTGFDTEGIDRITQAAEHIPIVMAPNMSVGVNVTFKLIEAAAKALGDDADVEVFEAHHRHKVDAPSGTAVRMGEILAHALGRDLSADAVYGREGITGERDTRTIGFHSLRAGDIVGEHTVTFAAPGERLEITHRAHSRMNFAMGALRAVRYVATRDAGLFDVADVLGIAEGL